MAKVKIAYTITGTLEVDEEAFKDYASNNDQNWDELSTKEKVEVVKKCEDECGFEGELEDAANGKIELTSVTIE